LPLTATQCYLQNIKCFSGAAGDPPPACMIWRGFNDWLAMVSYRHVSRFKGKATDCLGFFGGQDQTCRFCPFLVRFTLQIGLKWGACKRTLLATIAHYCLRQKSVTSINTQPIRFFHDKLRPLVYFFDFFPNPRSFNFRVEAQSRLYARTTPSPEIHSFPQSRSSIF